MEPLRKRVNLRDYPRAWAMLTRGLANPTKARASSNEARDLCRTKLGIEVDVLKYDLVGFVYMDHKTYTWFVLRWS